MRGDRAVTVGVLLVEPIAVTVGEVVVIVKEKELFKSVDSQRARFRAVDEDGFVGTLSSVVIGIGVTPNILSALPARKKGPPRQPAPAPMGTRSKSDARAETRTWRIIIGGARELSDTLL